LKKQEKEENDFKKNAAVVFGGGAIAAVAILNEVCYKDRAKDIPHRLHHLIDTDKHPGFEIFFLELSAQEFIYLGSQQLGAGII
jgi:hypothetical protein